MADLRQTLHDLLKLQEVEGAVARAEADLAAIPARMQAADLSLSGAEAALALAHKRLGECGKERRSLERDVEAVKTIISRHQDQLMQVKTNEQYRALNKEITTERGKIEATEEKILVNLERADDLGREVAEREVALGRERERVATEKAVLAAERHRLEQERDDLGRERDEARRRLPGEALALYRRVVEMRGVAVARIVGEACGECRVRGRPQALVEARSFQRLVQCESCQRILVPPPEPAGEVAAEA